MMLRTELTDVNEKLRGAEASKGRLEEDIESLQAQVGRVLAGVQRSCTRGSTEIAWAACGWPLALRFLPTDQHASHALWKAAEAGRRSLSPAGV